MTALTENEREQFDRYITDLFAPEDEILQSIHAETRRHEIPAINIRASEGRLLQFLAQAVGVRKIVEIGALAGYSGIWLARALLPGGKLYSLEKSSKHARVARSSFERAGLSDRAEVLEGPALETLRKLRAEGPFDMVFIDADKGSYLEYMNWAAENLRPGGLVAAHNAFRHGRILLAQDDDDRAMQAFNAALAADLRFFSTILAIGDGMAVGIKR